MINTEKKTMEKKTLFDKFFCDSNGNIVIAQSPNPPIILWGVASLLKLVFTSGLTNIALDLIAFGSLFTWAWLELFQGVNYFRRTLGFIVLVGFVWFRIYSHNPV
ncbi:hypothetical protein Sta7437_4917 (plasmid) [Stanieria cyanosphaera PCC 7437]|uniref:Uncharacterized protein n=2 Tax=Stanieria cyanosphaera TaxID=102116 RepID=K9Y1Y2_STAC7|nr:hypothetical protein Sta7437_4917 [Stanieria cyanosphaera PCC 7437]